MNCEKTTVENLNSEVGTKTELLKSRIRESFYGDYLSRNVGNAIIRDIDELVELCKCLGALSKTTVPESCDDTGHVCQCKGE